MTNMRDSTSLSANELLGQFDQLVIRIEELSEVSPYVKQSGCTQKLKNLLSELYALPETNLASLHHSLCNTLSWREFPLVLDDLICKVTQANLVAHPFMEEKGPIRAICQPEACTDGPSQSDVDDVLIALASEEIAVTIAQGIVDAIPQTIADIPNPPYYIALAVKVALELAAKGTNLAAAILQRAANVRAACEENAFQQVVFDMCSTLNQVKASLDALHVKIDLLDMKINSLLTLVVELTKLTKRLYLFELEEKLVHCETFLVSLYLPETVNGKLGEVQELIQSLTTASITAGLSTGNAVSLLKQGIAAVTSQEYCQALHWFSLAYQELIGVQCCVQKECSSTHD